MPVGEGRVAIVTARPIGRRVTCSAISILIHSVCCRAVLAQCSVCTARNVDGGEAMRFRARMLGLVAIAANLTCCSSARLTPSDQPDMSQECSMMRQLAADKTLTPVQLADIRKNMDKAGCSIIP